MNDEITARLITPDGEPLAIAGVLLDIRFYVGGQFRYLFSLGRTDGEGVCRTGLEEIERQLETNRQTFLMDYNTPLATCDSVVGIAAPTAGELAERAVARAKWWPGAASPQSTSANQLVRCSEQTFELRQGRSNAFELVCGVGPEA